MGCFINALDVYDANLLPRHNYSATVSDTLSYESYVSVYLLFKGNRDRRGCPWTVNISLLLLMFSYPVIVRPLDFQKNTRSFCAIFIINRRIMLMGIIDLDHVSMTFRMDLNRPTGFKGWVVNALTGNRNIQEFHALTDISFSVERGEVVGVIGRNGAGKSTLLKIISGIYRPTKGTVSLGGNVAPMLELGSGFDPELTGNENIFLNGAILGYSEKYLKTKQDEIVAFSELNDFINMPIKTYSSGMIMRLAFSIATSVIPEILIVDEILAVGDEFFQKKSFTRMQELMSGGTTVLFVSHSIDQIKSMCDRVIWLDHGQIKVIGDTVKVCDLYSASENEG